MRIVFTGWHGTPHTRRWISFFADRGHDVHIVTCGDGDAVDHDEAGRVLPRRYAVHDLGPVQLGKPGYLAKLPAARRVIRALRPDLVHAHYATSYGLLAHASGVRPLVVTAHGDDVLVAPRNPLMRTLVRRVLRTAALVTVPAEHMRAPVEALLRPRTTPVVTMQYGVDVARLEAVAAAVRAERRAAGPLRIASMRQLWRPYRVDALLDALAILHDRGVDLLCDVAGDGPEREPLERRAEALGLGSSVTFHGYVAPAAAERLVAAADVYVSVAESDGLSIGLLEALALGTVPVLSDIPANRGWVEPGVTGALVPIEPAAIADGIAAAAALDRDRAERENRRRVRERADRETNLARLEELLEGLV